jgi:hypothetical protein
VAFSAACGDDNNGNGPSAPATPTGLTVTQLSLTSAHVSWQASAGATSYVLERADAANPGVFTQIGGSIATTSYDDATLSAGVAYNYRVSASNATGTSAPTTPVAFTSGLKAAIIDQNITTNRTLYADTVYTLRGFITVGNGATLTVQAGTKVIGDTTVIQGGADYRGSSLFILKGAKLDAQGTANNPIVFTSARPVGNRAPGDWGGLVLIGNANVNRPATSCFTEGPAAAAQDYCKATPNAFDDNDNSGTLRYVRIEFAGFDVGGTGGKELNSLTMYRIGKGTTLEYIQTMAGLDDGYEFFGGDPDARYLISYETGDDHFDWTEGFRGRIQYMIALQTQRLTPSTLNPTGQFSSDPRGFEGDGCASNENPDCTFDSQPFSMPVFANFTVIGPGSIAGLSSTLRNVSGATIRRGSGGVLLNGIIARWKGYGLNLQDNETNTRRTTDSLNIVNVVFAETAGGTYDPGNAPTDLAGQAGIWDASNHDVQAGNGVADLITSVNPAALDWRAKAGSIADQGGSADAANGGVNITVTARLANYFGGTLAGTTYRGAAGAASAAWWSGWTSYAIN